MPTLREVQDAMRQSLVRGDSAAISAMLAARIAPDRLDIYRNTFLLTLTRALRLSFPAVQRLVGDAFFECAAQIFIADHPPRAAWLDAYGGAFPEFLRDFAPARSVPYLSDVATLEWAVSTALHAPDTAPLDPNLLAAIATADQGLIRLIVAPSLSLLDLAYPADVIWQAVLSGDDEALGSVDPASGRVRLLVERRRTGVDVERLDGDAWTFLSRLCAGEPIEEAIDLDSDLDVSSVLAAHLSGGRFAGFELVSPPAGTQQ